LSTTDSNVLSKLSGGLPDSTNGRITLVLAVLACAVLHHRLDQVEKRQGRMSQESAGSVIAALVSFFILGLNQLV
jgi:hypothetical protein